MVLPIGKCRTISNAGNQNNWNPFDPRLITWMRIGKQRLRYINHGLVDLFLVYSKTHVQRHIVFYEECLEAVEITRECGDAFNIGTHRFPFFNGVRNAQKCWIELEVIMAPNSWRVASVPYRNQYIYMPAIAIKNQGAINSKIRGNPRTLRELQLIGIRDGLLSRSVGRDFRGLG